MATVKIIPKELFFDRENVLKHIRDTDRESARYFGAYVRKVARNSMKKAPTRKMRGGKKRRRALTTHGRFRTIKSGQRKGEKRFERGLYSPPGSPPYWRTAGFNLKKIVYFYDKRDGSVNVATVGGSGTASRNVPATLEAGGSLTVRIPGGMGRSDSGRLVMKTTRAKYEARPFMQPAGEAGVKRFSGWYVTFSAKSGARKYKKRTK